MDYNNVLLDVFTIIEKIDPPMSVAELRIFLCIGAFGTIEQSEVGSKARKSLVSRHVASLEQKRGWVRVEDTGKQRNILHITKAGLDMLDTITEPIRRNHERVQKEARG